MRRVFGGVKALGDLAGALLLVGTLIAVVFHVLHGIWPPVPDILPMVSLSN